MKTTLKSIVALIVIVAIGACEPDDIGADELPPLLSKVLEPME